MERVRRRTEEGSSRWHHGSPHLPPLGVVFLGAVEREGAPVDAQQQIEAAVTVEVEHARVRVVSDPDVAERLVGVELGRLLASDVPVPRDAAAEGAGHDVEQAVPIPVDDVEAALASLLQRDVDAVIGERWRAALAAVLVDGQPFAAVRDQ